MASFRVGKGTDVLALTITRATPPDEEHAVTDALILLLDRNPQLTLVKVTLGEAEVGRVLGTLEGSMPKRKGKASTTFVEAGRDGALVVGGDYTTHHGVVTHHQVECQRDGWALNGPIASRHSANPLTFEANLPGLTTPSRFHAPHPLIITPDPAPLIGHQEEIVVVKDVEDVRVVVDNADVAKLGELGHLFLPSFFPTATMAALAEQANKLHRQG